MVVLSVRNMSGLIGTVIRTGIVILLICSFVQMEPAKMDLFEHAAGSVWTTDSETEFNKGSFDKIIIEPDPVPSIDIFYETRYFDDGFKDESKIKETSNIIVDTTKGEVVLANQEKIFTRYMGGGSDEYAFSVLQSSDGGYVIIGETSSSGAGGQDMWLVKTDSSGHIQWNSTFGGSGVDIGRSVEETSDGGYIIAGYTTSYGAGAYDIWLVKTDSLGTEEWNRTFGDSFSDIGYEVHETADAGFITVGVQRDKDGWDDVTLIKTDSSGNLVWNHTYGDRFIDEAGFSVEATGDYGYILVGKEWNNKGTNWDDVLLIKTNATGVTEWNRTFGGKGSDEGNSVLVTSDGGYIIAGTTETYGAGNGDVWLIRTNQSGVELWNRTYGGNVLDKGRSVFGTLDGGFIIAGSKGNPNPPKKELFLIKTNATGIMEWNRTHGDFEMNGHYVSGTTDGGFVVTGDVRLINGGDADIFLMKTNGTGDSSVTGYMISAEILEGQDVRNTALLEYAVEIPKDSTISVQFSNDGLSWYNSSKAVNMWEQLVHGKNSLVLQIPGESNGKLFYRVRLGSENLAVPVLKSINISYTIYHSTGMYVSKVYDTGNNTVWKALNWSSNMPDETELKFQLRTGSTESKLLASDFVGSDGRVDTYYTIPGSAVWAGHGNDSWIQFRALLFTTNGSKTPSIEKVEITFNRLPLPPQLLQPQNNAVFNNSEVLFRWDYQDNDSIVQAGFQIRLGDSPGFESITFDSGKMISNETQYVFQQSLPDGRWYWKVRTCDPDGDWGPFSQVRDLTIDTMIARPENVTVTPSSWASFDHFEIDWQNPPDTTDILTGAYYHIGDSPPESSGDGIWSGLKPLHLKANIQGTTSVFLWLKDTAGNRNHSMFAKAVLKLDLNPPEIVHTPVAAATKGYDINITAYVTDRHSGVSGVFINFKEQGESSYKRILMKGNDSIYSYTIPAENITFDELTYYIEARDSASPGNIAFYGKAGELDTKPVPGEDIRVEISGQQKIHVSVIGNSPAGDDVPVTTKISVVFNTTMERSVTQAGFSISPEVPGEFTWSDTELIFTPNEALEYNTVYTVRISGSAKDTFGNSLEKGFEWSFTTEIKKSEPSFDEKKGGLDQFTAVIILLLIVLLVIVSGLAFVRRSKVRKDTLPAETGTEENGDVMDEEKTEDERIEE